MVKIRKSWLIGFISLLTAFAATPAFAKPISFKDAGVTLWIFIIIGTVIVLLQLVPAAILFFSFVGTSSNLVFKGKKESDKRAVKENTVLTRIEPAPVKK